MPHEKPPGFGEHTKDGISLFQEWLQLDVSLSLAGLKPFGDKLDSVRVTKQDNTFTLLCASSVGTLGTVKTGKLVIFDADHVSVSIEEEQKAFYGSRDKYSVRDYFRLTKMNPHGKTDIKIIKIKDNGFFKNYAYFMHANFHKRDEQAFRYELVEDKYQLQRRFVEVASPWMTETDLRQYDVGMVGLALRTAVRESYVSARGYEPLARIIVTNRKFGQSQCGILYAPKITGDPKKVINECFQMKPWRV